MPISAFLRHHRRVGIAAAIAGGLLAFLLSIVQPLRYGATMRVLIIQSTSPTLDAFTAVKSAEKIGKNLGQIIASSSFFVRVLQANPAIDAGAFSLVERKRRKLWERTVETSVAAETSVLEIRVFHTLQAQARAIADGIATVLVRDAAEYTGGRDIAVRVIDSPLVSRFPVRPNIPLTVAIGFLLGGLLGTAVQYLRKEARS